MSDSFRDASSDPRTRSGGHPPDPRPGGFGHRRAPDPGRPPGILVVDDEPFVVRVVERLLFRAGYRTASALEAAEALELVRSSDEPFALLVADLSLPGAGGAGLLEEARALQPGLRGLFMRSRIVDAGSMDPAVPVLTKPFGSRQLYSTVADLLGRGASAAPDGDGASWTGELRAPFAEAGD